MTAIKFFTEKILLERAASGDSDAFEVLYNKYAKKIFRFIYFKVREREAVDDLTNDVFLRLWESLQKGVRIQSLKAYLYKIARHAVIDHYRGRREQIALEEAVLVRDYHKDLEEEIIKDHEIGDLLNKITKLRGDYKEVLLMRYVEDLSITEISHVLEKSKGSVKVMIHRAVKQLQSQYKNKPEHDGPRVE